MKLLQEALNSAIKNIPQSLLADLLGEKLAAQGIRLSRRQCEKLARQAINEKLDSFDLPSWRFWQYRRFRKPRDLLIEFTTEDTQKIATALKEFSDRKLPELIQNLIAEQPESILATLQRRWKSQLKKQLRDERGFRRRLQKRWGLPIEQLRMLLTIAREFCSNSIANCVNTT